MQNENAIAQIIEALNPLILVLIGGAVSIVTALLVNRSSLKMEEQIEASKKQKNTLKKFIKKIEIFKGTIKRDGFDSLSFEQNDLQDLVQLAHEIDNKNFRKYALAVFDNLNFTKFSGVNAYLGFDSVTMYAATREDLNVLIESAHTLKSDNRFDKALLDSAQSALEAITKEVEDYYEF